MSPCISHTWGGLDLHQVGIRFDWGERESVDTNTITTIFDHAYTSETSRAEQQHRRRFTDHIQVAGIQVIFPTQPFSPLCVARIHPVIPTMDDAISGLAKKEGRNVSHTVPGTESRVGKLTIRLRQDVLDSLLDAVDVVGVLVGDLNAELLRKSQY